MRVLLVAGVDLSRPGGVETHVLELAQALAGRGHEVEIAGRPPSLPPFRMVDAIDPRRYDVVHHHGGAWPRAIDARNRYVRTFHFSVAAKMETYVRMGRLQTLVNPGNYRALAEERSALKRGGRLLAVSETVRRDLERLHRVEPGRIRVIPNGARFDSPRWGRSAWRERHGIDARAPILLTIGRSDFVKGLDLLRRVWRGLDLVPRGAIWVAVGGDRPERAAGWLQTGPIPARDVTEWIYAADVGAFPSYYEGNSIGLLEMLAGGLYTLSHRVGAAPEVIRGGENGEILERSVSAWREALGPLLATPPPRARNGLPEAYRWGAIAARVEELYGESEGA